MKKSFVKVSQNSQENSVPESLFKKRLWRRRFPVNFSKFSTTAFLQNTFRRLLITFPSNFTKMGTPSSVWKTSDEYSLFRNTNLRSIVQVCHFFLGSINFQCVFSLVYTVYGQKLPPEYRCSVRKGVLKKFVKFIGKHLCWSLFLIKLQA